LQSVSEKYSSLVKTTAKKLGFDFCGISKAEFLEEEAQRLENWLKKNQHGEMAYMENYFDKRLDPRLLVPGAKSVISLLYNYYPENQNQNPNYKISKYAFGDDYHEVIKEKLKNFLSELKNQIGDISGRAFVDSAPVLEKVWAKKAGLGWIGKNSNLITKSKGSFFFLAELILDVELKTDEGIRDYCGTCTKCIDACPTEAIVEPYVVDGSKCISYLTIELKNEIPQSFASKMDNWVFGCDVCQDVCPWNRFSELHNEPLFKDKSSKLELTNEEWEELSEEGFKILFKNSAIKRTKYKGLKRNIQFIKPVK
jgi:epoxyqueuosine reductase